MSAPRLLLPKRFPLGSAQRKQLTPYQHRQPKPWRLIEPLHEKAIVIPWLSTAAVWDELKYSLRSIHRYFTDRECPIYIIGNAAPSWLAEGRVRFIEIPQYQESNEAGLWEAWQQGVQIAKEVMWTNDDIYFLREVGWNDLRVALTEGALDDAADELRSSRNSWRDALGNAVEDLHALGIKPVWRFATHTPYLFEIEKSRAIMNTFYLAHKGSWVTLYHNYHATPHVPCDPYKTMSLPCSGDPWYLNHRHKGPDTATKAALSSAFSNKAPWEK